MNMTACAPVSVRSAFRPHRVFSIACFLICSFIFYCRIHGYSADPEAEKTVSTTNAPAKPKPMMVVVTNRMQTLMGWFGPERTFPVSDGNQVFILQIKPAPPDGMETHTDLHVVNILAENLTEILKRIGTETIEMAIYPGTNRVSTFKDRGQPERKVAQQTGYAVITDTRIPREWFLSSPKLGNLHLVNADEILAAFPLSFSPKRTD